MPHAFQPFPLLKTTFPALFSLLESLFPLAEKVGIAVSGGSDSMLLSFLIAGFRKEKKWDKDQLFFLHCNHQVRKESQTEALFLQNFFQKRNFQIFIRKENGTANEEVLRERRYDAFYHFCKDNQIKILALGHNLTDRIETSLMHMMRGCGLKGFMNMEVQDSHHFLPNVKVIRPLLNMSKQEIEQICKKFEIPFVQDMTNFESETSLRNHIRNDFLFPLSTLSLSSITQKNTFFKSRKELYTELEKNKKSDGREWLLPLKKSPYWGADQAFEWNIPSPLRTDLPSIVQLFQLLEIPLKKSELEEFQTRLKNAKDGFREIGKWVFFFSHQKVFVIKGKKRFREKPLVLEKYITNTGIQTFGSFQLEIQEDILGSTLRFPKSGDHYKGKLLTKRAINQKIPLFWRNALPLAEKDGKIIFIFTPQQLLF